MTGYTNNLHPDLMSLLVELEAAMGFELQITSGYRDPTHNKDVGGVEGSEHTSDPAQAADVFCQRSVTRFRMVEWLLQRKVRRIGIGNTFIHIGISQDKGQYVMWDYYPESQAGRSTQV